MGSFTITAASWLTGQATYTTSAAHGLVPGNQVIISGVNPAGYNGTFIAAAGTTAETIVVDMPTNPGAYVSGGSVTLGDPFSVYPALVTGRIGVARDGSVWVTRANTMVQVAPAGTVSPQMLKELGVQPASASAPARAPAMEDEDEPERRTTTRHRR